MQRSCLFRNLSKEHHSTKKIQTGEKMRDERDLFVNIETGFFLFFLRKKIDSLSIILGQFVKNY